ncbi:TetR/AcrR family transcriptional regulator [Aerophototrophica crusticola]|uniref:TetR/AcrR family transcriptional regulator n=1 Tax=Aerophototrophica crusticola TaxID=1709002 RepID=A0A858R7B3_9PROT|nr:TetR/AcrR family transcriptional regulator [Rhodospirillaceae bacterium B3]
MAGTGVGAEEAPRTDGKDTKEVILDAAERLFAERSYASVSLRELTAAAGVNLAAVNYHFGSKDALLLAVFRRGAVTLNKERARLLREAEARAGDQPPPVREIVEALVGPAIRASLTGTALSLYNQFYTLARAGGPPELREMLEKDVGHLQRFVTALTRALPHLPAEEVYWRLHLSLGVQHGSSNDLGRLATLSGGLCQVTDRDALVRRVVDYVTAGLTAPFDP